MHVWVCVCVCVLTLVASMRVCLCPCCKPLCAWDVCSTAAMLGLLHWFGTQRHIPFPAYLLCASAGALVGIYSGWVLPEELRLLCVSLLFSMGPLSFWQACVCKCECVHVSFVWVWVFAH